MVETKLKLLEQSLTKKNELLDSLLELGKKQDQLLDKPSMIMEEFDECMDEQDDLIVQLNQLNTQTEELYQNIQAEYVSDLTKYEDMTMRIKALVSLITDKIVLVNEKEQANKQKLEKSLQAERKNYGEGRRTSKAALDYYKNMSKSNVVPPQFMDKKK